ncbi:MAG: hypothetical protein ACLFPF_07120 [Halanaerobiales bacterium]
MPRLYGELETPEKLRVRTVSYSGNRQGGVEVDRFLKGEGTHYVNPQTGEQWYENPGTEDSKDDVVKETEAKIQELSKCLKKLKENDKGKKNGMDK